MLGKRLQVQNQSFPGFEKLMVFYQQEILFLKSPFNSQLRFL